MCFLQVRVGTRASSCSHAEVLRSSRSTPLAHGLRMAEKMNVCEQVIKVPFFFLLNHYMPRRSPLNITLIINVYGFVDSAENCGRAYLGTVS